MKNYRPKTRRSRSQAGVALLMVLTATTILSLVLMEFSGSAHTHLRSGINLRDEMRAVTMADTSLALTRACLDPAAWDSLRSMQENMDLEQLCRIMLNLFIKARIDLPIGGLSVELPPIGGLGLFRRREHGERVSVLHHARPWIISYLTSASLYKFVHLQDGHQDGEDDD